MAIIKEKSCVSNNVSLYIELIELWILTNTILLAKLHKYNMEFFCGRFPYTMTQKTASYDKKSKRYIYARSIFIHSFYKGLQNCAKLSGTTIATSKSPENSAPSEACSRSCHSCPSATLLFIQIRSDWLSSRMTVSCQSRRPGLSVWTISAGRLLCSPHTSVLNSAKGSQHKAPRER